MDRLDAIQQVAWDCPISVGILGNTQTDNFELVALDTVPLPADVVARYSARGFTFLGIIGLPSIGQPPRTGAQSSDGLSVSPA